jgi:transposase-like protein
MDNQSRVIIPVPEVEVSSKATRRRFTEEYKRRILAEADGCTMSGELGALLRREGLYSSHLATWRQAAARGELSGKKRGPKAKPVDPAAKEILKLERENRQLRRRAERAEALVEVPKKVAALLGNDLPSSEGES